MDFSDEEVDDENDAASETSSTISARNDTLDLVTEVGSPQSQMEPQPSTSTGEDATSNMVAVAGASARPKARKQKTQPAELFKRKRPHRAHQHEGEGEGDLDRYQKAVLDVLKKDDSPNPEKGYDEVQMWLLSLATEVRELTKQDRLRFKSRVTQMLLDYQMSDLGGGDHTSVIQNRNWSQNVNSFQGSYSGMLSDNSFQPNNMNTNNNVYSFPSQQYHSQNQSMPSQPSMLQNLNTQPGSQISRPQTPAFANSTFPNPNSNSSNNSNNNIMTPPVSSESEGRNVFETLANVRTHFSPN